MIGFRLTFQLSFELWGALFSLLCGLLLYISREIKGLPGKALARMMFANAFLQLFDIGAYIFRGDTRPIGFLMTRICNYMVYFLQSFLVFLGVLYLYKILEARGHKPEIVYYKIVKLITFSEILLLTISQFTDFYYGFDENNIYYRNSGAYYSFIIEIIAIFIFLFILLKYKKKMDKVIFGALFIFMAIPIFCTIFQMIFYGLSIINVGTNVSLVLLFIVYQYDQSKFIEKQQDDIDHNIDILKSLACIYISIHALDLKTDTLTTYVSTSLIDAHMEGNKNASIQIDRIMSLLVTDAYKERIRDFVKLSTLESRLAGKNVITCEFVGKINGWCRASFMPVEYDKDGSLRYVTYSVQSINEEKENAKHLMDLSRIDGLTGLLNRLAYENDIEDMRGENLPIDLTFISMDVNGLKNVNDNLGHAKGDKLLRDAGKCICDIFEKEGARIYRMGGDEFMVILDTDGNRLGTLCDGFEHRMREYRDESYGVLSISFGFASRCEAPMKTLKEIEKLADDRMYDMKRKTHQGRL